MRGPHNNTGTCLPPLFAPKDISPDGSKDRLLDDPHKAFTDVFPQSHPLLQRPTSCPDSSWNNHILALHAVVYELCSLASGASFLDLMLEAAQEILPRTVAEADDEPAAPAHSFACLGCRILVEMNSKEVAWFIGKQFALPKRCKACRSRPR